MKILQEIDDQQWFFSATIVTTLAKTREILDQLDKLLRSKILSEANGSSRVRRRAWAKHRTKVYDLHRSLADYKESLMIAILTNGS